MSVYFLDSSAVLKLYQQEKGSAEVHRVLSEPAAHFFISRLAVVEIQRAFARKVREGKLSEVELEELRRAFYDDLLEWRFRVKRLRDYHYHSAVRLVRKYAPVSQSIEQSAAGKKKASPLLRTLDALQLVVALDLQRREGLDAFVAADEDLCEVAKAEQLTVINPEQPEDS